jgi:hypothetical protein
MTKLHVTLDVALPLKFLELRVVVWGGSGAGKTTGSRVMFEEATRAGVVSGAVDLKADWHGLQSSADGKAKGIPVVIFGGEHADVAITPDAGTVTAATIVDLRQPWVLDLEQFSKGQQIRFLAPFLETLYDRNREPMVVFFDEADRYAPQKPMSPEANIALGATEDIAKRGRKHGIFPVFITQRNQALNKDVSELCDAAFVYRTPGPRAQEAALDWFGSKATREEMDEVRAAIASLETGEAFLCSADPKVRIFKRIHVRAPETFDSSATPEIGKRRVEPKVFAKAELKAIEERMAATIAKAKSDDPKALRAEIAALKKQVASGAAAAPKMVQQRVEVAVLKNGTTKILAKAAADLLRASEKLTAFGGDLGDAIGRSTTAAHVIASELKRIASAPSGASSTALASWPARDTVDGAPVRAAAPRPTVQVPERRAGVPSAKAERASVRPRSGEPRVTTDGITSRQQRFLDAAAALYALNVETTRATVSSWLGVHPRGGSVGEELKALEVAGLITLNRGAITLTEEGMAASSPPSEYDPLEQAKRGLSPRQRRIFDIILSVHPDPITRDAIAESMGIHPRGGSFGEDLGRLRGRGLITLERGSARARDFLFAGVR